MCRSASSSGVTPGASWRSMYRGTTAAYVSPVFEAVRTPRLNPDSLAHRRDLQTTAFLRLPRLYVGAQAGEGRRRDQPPTSDLLVGLVVVAVPVHRGDRGALRPREMVLHRPDAGGARR